MVHEVIVGRFTRAGAVEDHRFLEDMEVEGLRRQLIAGGVHYFLDRAANRPDADWWLSVHGAPEGYGFVRMEPGEGRAVDRLPPGARTEVYRTSEERRA